MSLAKLNPNVPVFIPPRNNNNHHRNSINTMNSKYESPSLYPQLDINHHHSKTPTFTTTTTTNSATLIIPSSSSSSSTSTKGSSSVSRSSGWLTFAKTPPTTCLLVSNPITVPSQHQRRPTTVGSPSGTSEDSPGSSGYGYYSKNNSGACSKKKNNTLQQKQDHHHYHQDKMTIVNNSDAIQQNGNATTVSLKQSVSCSNRTPKNARRSTRPVTHTSQPSPKTAEEKTADRERRMRQRQKQIDIGKTTIGYRNYAALVPKSQRIVNVHPVTPRKNTACSKRAWDGVVKVWRRALHKYDNCIPPPQNDCMVFSDEVDFQTFDIDMDFGEDFSSSDPEGVDITPHQQQQPGSSLTTYDQNVFLNKIW